MIVAVTRITDTPIAKGTLKAMQRRRMLCTKEPITRPAEHNKHPNIVEIRIPNLFRKAPITGPRKHRTLNKMEETQAVKQRRNVISLTGL